MNARERFDKVRRDKSSKLSLRARLTILVAMEFLISIGITYGVTILVRVLFPQWFVLQWIFGVAGICLLISVLITGYLSKYFFDPIQKLRTAMDQVAAGDFSVRLENQSNSNEIMEIYTGFNLMAHELSTTEILQTDFVSNVSHEFKTPIGAIEGYSTLLQDSDNLRPEQREYVDKILFNTQRLSSLVSSVLLLSKLENQQIATGKTLYRLDEQIRQSIVALESQWESKEITLDVELQRCNYNGNEPMMRHVWDNLISNAIKFTPHASTVTVHLAQHGDALVFTVADQGPGLSDEAKKHIFDKFYQADSAHKAQGHGLGLSLAKRIIAIEKGSIRADNLPEGGCQFTVTLNT